MPIKRRIVAQYGLVHVRHCGATTVQDDIDCYVNLLKDKAFDPDHHILVDHEVSSLETVNYERLKRLLVELEPFYSRRTARSKTSVFAPGDIQFGVTRQYLMMSEPVVTRRAQVFRTKAEALAFLGLEPSDPELLQTLWPE